MVFVLPVFIKFSSKIAPQWKQSAHDLIINERAIFEIEKKKSILFYLLYFSLHKACPRSFMLTPRYFVTYAIIMSHSFLILVLFMTM